MFPTFWKETVFYPPWKGTLNSSLIDAILKTLVEFLLTFYVSQWDFPFGPLAPTMKKVFSSTHMPITQYFLFLRPFSVNPGDGCEVVKVPVDQQLVKLSSAPTTLFTTSKVISIPFPVGFAGFGLQQDSSASLSMQ